jgi:hypothetical protein
MSGPRVASHNPHQRVERREVVRRGGAATRSPSDWCVVAPKHGSKDDWGRLFAGPHSVHVVLTRPVVVENHHSQPGLTGDSC